MAKSPDKNSPSATSGRAAANKRGGNGVTDFLDASERICSPLHNHSATRPDDVSRFGFFHIA